MSTHQREQNAIDYAPGMRVMIRDEEWMVKRAENNSLSGKTLHCVGISSLVKDHDAIFLADLEEIEQVDPSKVRLVADDSPFFQRSRLYIESQWRQMIPTDDALHIGNRAAMDTLPYQLEPAQMALRKQRQRILMADSVGLGKTLEAGILISELIARGKGKRILVVTVKSMMGQFQKELWNRFTIPLVSLDSSRISRIRASLPTNHNPFFFHDKTIVSIDTLKRDVEYRTHLENSWWDIIVIDEAHNVAERGTRGNHAQRSKLAKLLSERSDTLIMLSATPHDGKSESFASLMKMLDYTAIADPSNYKKEDIKGLCVRRFKKDIKNQVQGSFKERSVSVEKCDATPQEEAAYTLLAEMKLDMDAIRHARTGQLFKTSLEKSLFSSPAACIKSIKERLKKLEKRYSEGQIKDIALLKGLKAALEKIQPATFSRYQALLALLKDKNYGWSRAKNDRVVIFTERIETMKYLLDNLRQDLKMEESAIQEIHGGMSDIEQQRIVEQFGLEQSPIRVLVASDVASEGINLHHLSHRLIHFDIPWSLMVFQQRNGRIDRYGQRERPDIRYFVINSANQKIKGDVRIIEILIQKEKQAFENLGDPALIMGVFSVEEEEGLTAAAIESGATPDEFGAQLSKAEEEFDPFEVLMAGAASAQQQVQISDDETLFSDTDYVKTAIPFFTSNARDAVTKLQTVEGVQIKISDDLRRRLSALLPSEAMPSEDYLRLSPDKTFAMAEMERSMKNSLSENAWPQTQYLWKLHPLFSWINDKSSLLYGRGEAPVLALSRGLGAHDVIFVMAGTIPNRKSAPIVDQWFGLHYHKNALHAECSMAELLHKTKISRGDLPNQNLAKEATIKAAANLLPTAVADAKRAMDRHYKNYNDQMAPMINAEIDKLLELEKRHKSAQVPMLHDPDLKSKTEREIEKKFNEYVDWVKDTLQIDNNPYIRVVAVMLGA
ncbi:MAG: DEAD/DEAH box helicase [Holophagales bacterium]|nr:DEAD/DEAH box helicase [Holophagales bacterium]